MKPRLLVITSHPIQYQAPWFRALHVDNRVELKVLFLCLPDARQQGVGFGNAFKWDVPLLDGYDWQLAPSAKGSIREKWWDLRLRAASSDVSGYNPDCVLITGWQNLGMLQCLVAAARLALPVMLRAESNGLAPTSALRRLRNRRILQKANVLLPIGNANRKFYEQLGLASRLGPLVPYFVDNRFFADRHNEIRTERNEIRMKFGIPEESHCFLFAGKFVDKKRPFDLLKAIKPVRDRQESAVHLLMVGAGPLESELRKIITRKSLPVTFTGFLNQTEIPSAYLAADSLVLPSDFGETWGLVVNEAMACGLPAIVSDRVGCGPDLVVDGETGFQFHFGDIEDLAVKMSKMATMTPDKLRSMGIAAREKVNCDYSIERAVDNVVEAVYSLCNPGKKGTTY